MKFYAAMTSFAASLFMLGGIATSSVPAVAQYDQYGPPPAYTTWQPDWDQHQYDRHHVILGHVTAFSPYRLTVTRRNGDVQLVDLKHGTVIYPTGATPTPGERVALVGYYSNGTFIVNRVIIRP
jgi:Flp pilus assembly protein TadG